MLENLIESKNNARENRTRGTFLLTTLFLVVALCLSGLVWSLFAKDLAMSGADFDLASLVTPIPVIEDAPAPKLEKKVEPQSSSPVKNEITRQINLSRVDENFKVPEKISTERNQYAERPKGEFKTGKFDSAATAQNSFGDIRGKEGSGSGISGKGDQQSAETIEKETVKPPPPPPPLNTIPKNPPRNITVSLGVVNGKAISLPKPPYPPAAKAVKAQGEVNVQVTIDETGKVTAANAVSGNSLLRDAAERAARSARFAPTLLSNQPVKVSGVIVYRFAAN